MLAGWREGSSLAPAWLQLGPSSLGPGPSMLRISAWPRHAATRRQDGLGLRRPVIAVPFPGLTTGKVGRSRTANKRECDAPPARQSAQRGVALLVTLPLPPVTWRYRSHRHHLSIYTRPPDREPGFAFSTVSRETKPTKFRRSQ